MGVVDVVGVVGEIICWVGAIVGIPLLVIGLFIRRAQGTFEPTPLALIDDMDDAVVAIWTAAGRTCSRRLTEHESDYVREQTEPVGYVSPHDPDRMRVEHRSPGERACMTVAIVMLAAAVVGFLASLLPIFWG